jgi:L-lactate dehydrogenase complex protein LldF
MIDIPRVLLHLRARAVEAARDRPERAAMAAAAWVFGGPRRLAFARRVGALAQRPFVRGSTVRRLPGPLAGWTRSRDLRPLSGRSFRGWWRRRS